MGNPTRASLDGNSFDVLVIGGGIVGAGIARDAAMRGLRTLLVERADFASGTSSRSSRLLHGGLRYLAQGRIGLVREASVEKMRLSRIAPHLCQPMPFLFPIWRGMRWSLWQLSIGVRLYDRLCRGGNFGSSSTLRSADVLKVIPALRPDDLLGATRHFDALTNDARLVVDTLRSAEDSGAIVRNYTPFVSASRSRDVWECQLSDQVAGDTATLEAKAVVNAAGAWATSFPHSRIRLRLTKGVHLVISRDRLPVDEAVVVAQANRILFVIPWGERIILGTTDTDFHGDPAEVRTDLTDVSYILDAINGAFVNVALSPDDVIATWAGVRPLIAPRTAKHDSPSVISRRHVVRMTQPGWFDVAGGKLTTYRRMAEDAVDRVARHLGKRLPKSNTADELLSHGPFSSVLPPDVAAPVVAECCRREWSVHLDDVLMRRTSWHYYHSNHEEIARMTVNWMAEQLDWGPERQAAELDRYRDAADWRRRAT